MNTIAKTAFTIFLSVALLTACGDGEEGAAGSDVQETDETTTEVGNGNDTNEEIENEEENEKGDIHMSDDNASDSDARDKMIEGETRNEDAVEEELEPVEEGKELEVATTKENNYIQDGTFIGGEKADGRVIGNIDHGIHDDYERLTLDIYEGSYQELGDPVEKPNYFEVTKEVYPSRLFYTLNGIRGNLEEIPDLSNMDLFSYMETIPIFDDATIQLAVYVQKPIEFEVFELHDPAKIVTYVSPIEREDTYATVYSVRTTSISQDDNLEDIERLTSEFAERGAEQVRTLHSEADTIFVEEGYYSTLEEAEERKAELEHDDIDFDLHIEERGMHDIPELIE